MEIVYDLPHVFHPAARQLENAYALRVLLEALIALNLGYLRHHPGPTLYQSGVRYGRDQRWMTIPAMKKARKADCKSLAAALIAEYRKAGIRCKPVFRFVTRPDGGLDFHILVMTDTGFEDPSKVLGMGKNENAKFFGPNSFGDDVSAHSSSGNSTWG